MKNNHHWSNFNIKKTDTYEGVNNSVVTTFNIFENEIFVNNDYLICKRSTPTSIECNSIDAQIRNEININFWDSYTTNPAILSIETKNHITGIKHTESFEKESADESEDKQQNYSPDGYSKHTRRILKHAEMMFQHHSLNTKIQSGRVKNVELKHPQYYDFPPTEDNVVNFSFYISDAADELFEKLPSIGTAHVLLTAQTDLFKGYYGIANIASICNLNTFKSSAIVRWHENVLFTSQTLAHEIAHLLGIDHDNQITENGRNWTCENEASIMSTFSSIYSGQWSDCSNEDFKNYYLKVLAKKKFCLKT